MHPRPFGGNGFGMPNNRMNGFGTPTLFPSVGSNFNGFGMPNSRMNGSGFGTPTLFPSVGSNFNGFGHR